MLITTKEKEPQAALTDQDLFAACLAISSLDALMFYNCGNKSGASIDHKHMQIVPYNQIGLV